MARGMEWISVALCLALATWAVASTTQRDDEGTANGYWSKHILVCSNMNGFGVGGFGKGARAGFANAGDLVMIQPDTTLRWTTNVGTNDFTNCGGAVASNNWCKVCGCGKIDAPFSITGIKSNPKEIHRGTLVWKIGNDSDAKTGTWNIAGTYVDIHNAYSNTLYLGVWDNYSGDNRGCLTAKATILSGDGCKRGPYTSDNMYLPNVTTAGELLADYEKKLDLNERMNLDGVNVRNVNSKWVKVCADQHGFNDGGNGNSAFAGSAQAGDMVIIEPSVDNRWQVAPNRYSNVGGAINGNKWCQVCKSCQGGRAPFWVRGVRSDQRMAAGTLVWKIDNNPRPSHGIWHWAGTHTSIVNEFANNVYLGVWDNYSGDNFGCIWVKVMIFKKDVDCKRERPSSSVQFPSA